MEGQPRTLLTNVHDKSNLLALCHICHFAFDGDEWSFYPEDMASWVDELKANPELQFTYNARRDINFRRVLLQPDPDSKAYGDQYYRSAFI